MELVEKFVNTSVQLMLAVQHFNILVKADGLVPMTFKQAFWCYWIFMTVLAGIVTLCGIFMISNSYIICVVLVSRRCPEKSVRNCFALVGSFFVALASFMYCFGGFMVQLYEFLDGKQRAGKNVNFDSDYDPFFHYLAMGWLFLAAVVSGFGGRPIACAQKKLAGQHADPNR